MKNSKIFLYILIAIIPMLICFNVFYSDSFCLESTLTTTLWNSYNIASEYFVARTGKQLVGGNEVSTNISGVSGISDGSVNTDYGDVNAISYGKAPININDISALVKDVDVSKYSLEELNAISLIIANAPWTTNGNIVFKNLTYGGVALYFAVNKQGEWLGNSYDNILCSLKPKTTEITTNVTTYVDNNYEYDDLLYSWFFNPPLSIYTNYNQFQLYFYSSVYIYSVPSADAGKYLVHLVIPSSLYGNFINGASCDYRYRWENTTHTSSLGSRGSTTFTINNIEYVDVRPYVVSEGENIYATQQISDLDTIKAKILSDGFVGESINSELVDTQGVPYVVEDIEDYAGTISDIYEVIDELKKSVIDITNQDEMESIISDAIDLKIDELIDSIKEKTIHLNIDDTLDDSITDTLVNEGITIPDGFDDGIISNTLEVFELPFNFVSIFQPLFYLFGNFAGYYAIWSFVPIIFIAVLIIWALK